MRWGISVQEDALPHFVQWKGTLEGTSLCFIYHRGIQEGSLQCFFSNIRALRRHTLSPTPTTQACQCSPKQLHIKMETLKLKELTLQYIF